MEEENIKLKDDKRIKSYASTALFGGILQIFLGFGFGFVNIAIFLITLTTGIVALVKNKGRIKRVTVFSSIGFGLVGLAFILNFIFGLVAPIDYLLQAILR